MWGRGVAFGLMAALALMPSVAAAGTPPPGDFSRYRLDSPTPTIAPKAVAETQGQVTGADGALAPGGGVAKLVKPDPGAEPVLLLDFGRTVSGILEVVIADSDGAEVQFVPAERRRYLPDPFFPGTGDMQDDGAGSDDGTDRAPAYTPPKGPSRYSSPGVLGAQRWIAIRLTQPGSVSIDAVRLRPTHLLPGRDGHPGFFLSSDDELNRAWYLSAYTEQLNHPLDPEVILDGAKRDRLVWTGDLVVAAHTEMYTTARPQAILNSLRTISEVQRDDGYLPANRDPRGVSQPFENLTFASYVALWSVAAGILDRYTGDDAAMRELLPALRKSIAWLEERIGEDGLFVVRQGESANWHPPDLPTGKVADTNAAVYAALTAAAGIERRVGEAERARGLEARAAKLRAAFEAKLYDEAAGLYRLSDSSSAHPQDASVSAVLDGLASPARADRVLSALRERLWTKLGPATVDTDSEPGMTRYISPFVTSRELLARGERGDVTGGIELIRRLWGHFLREDPASTAWEKVDLNGEPETYNPNGLLEGVFPNQGYFQRGFSSLAHAWSTGPVPFLSGYVLGVRPRLPGFARWTVAPQTGGLRWARGAVPTPKGRIESWWRDERRTFELDLRAPKGTTGTITLPAGRSLRIDRRVVWTRTRGDRRGGPRVTASGGKLLVNTLRWGRAHRFLVRR